jgi:hypothetical protein
VKPEEYEDMDELGPEEIHKLVSLLMIGGRYFWGHECWQLTYYVKWENLRQWDKVFIAIDED